MKIFSTLALSVLALLATTELPPAQAVLTKHDTTYDLMVIHVRRNIRAMTQLVFDENKAELTDAYVSFIGQVEEPIWEGEMSFHSFQFMRQRFLNEDANVLGKEYAASLPGKVIAKAALITESAVLSRPSPRSTDDEAVSKAKGVRQHLESTYGHLSPDYLAVSLASVVIDTGNQGRDYAEAIENVIAAQTSVMEDRYGDSDLDKFPTL